MAKIKRYSYSVYFDSSSIYGEPIAKQIVDFIEKYKSDDRIAIKIYLPEVVAKELERKILVDIKNKHKQTLKNMRYLTHFFPDINASIPEKISDVEIVDAKERILKELSIEIVPTPTNKIDWQNIIDRATQYQIPFEEAHEKGFKDMLIAETAINHFLDTSHKSVFAFVGNDSKMNEYLIEKTDRYKKFNIFESVPALDTDIQLRLDENTSKIVDALKTAASKAFYDEANKKSLYRLVKIGEQLNRFVEDLVASQEFKERYPTFRLLRRSPPLNIEIANPIFIKRPDKATFYWRSLIVFNVSLEVQPLDELQSKEVTLKVELSVEWHATFTKKGAVLPLKMKIDNSTVSSYDIKGLSNPLNLTSSLSLFSKGLTTIGQPTFPVSALDILGQTHKDVLTASQAFNKTLSQIQQPRFTLSDSLKTLLNGNSDKDKK